MYNTHQWNNIQYAYITYMRIKTLFTFLTVHIQYPMKFGERTALYKPDIEVFNSLIEYTIFNWVIRQIVTKYWVSVCNSQPDPLLNIVWWSSWVRQIRGGHSPKSWLLILFTIQDKWPRLIVHYKL